MRKRALVFGCLILLTGLNLFSQSFDYLDRNQIKALINSNGSLFCRNSSYAYPPSFEVPQGLGTTTIDIANLWVAGIDELGSLRGVGATYFQFEEYYFGPVADNYDSQLYKDTYNRVWKVSLSEIQYHIENFNQEGYELPEAFLNWPAHGNTENGESEDLAPYYDYNQNGIYDPRNGDFPAIRGDQAVYFIFNEALGHQFTGGAKMGLEFHGMAYCFNPSIGSTLTQTIFISYNIINRSNHEYSDFYAGLWCDFGLGNTDDDVFGSDSINHLMYVYNQNNSDALFGDPSPAQGVVLLNSEIKAIIPQYCCSGADTIIDYSVRGLNQWGNEFHFGGGVGGYPTTYAYSGYPELGTGWFAENGNGGFYGSNVSGMISAGPYNLKSNQSICLDFAFPYARDLSGSHLTAISLLRQKSAAIIQFFNDNDFNCQNEELGISSYMTNYQMFSVFPNPSNGKANLDLTAIKGTEKKISVITGDGKLIRQITTSNENLEIDLQEKGVYIILVETEDFAFSRKLIIL